MRQTSVALQAWQDSEVSQAHFCGICPHRLLIRQRGQERRLRPNVRNSATSRELSTSCASRGRESLERLASDGAKKRSLMALIAGLIDGDLHLARGVRRSSTPRRSCGLVAFTTRSRRSRRPVSVVMKALDTCSTCATLPTLTPVSALELRDGHKYAVLRATDADALAPRCSRTASIRTEIVKRS